MSKDPAFLFYPGDYISGTMGMTFEEKGAYIDLLMMQFNRGHMTERMITQVIGHIWDNIKVKFMQDDDGKWYNKRLEEEQIKRQEFTKSRRNNISGINQHTKNSGHMRGHMTAHMEDENENINDIKNKELSKYQKPENIQECIDYFTEKGYWFGAAESFYNHFDPVGWVDKNGKHFNWKQKAVQWFKEENKIEHNKPVTEPVPPYYKKLFPR